MPYIGKTPTQGVRERYYYTASGSETSLSGADDNGATLNYADSNYVDVYLNGLLLVADVDYNTNTANTIAGLAALAASDIVEILVYDVFSIFGGDITGSISVQKDNLKIAGVAVTTTAAELNKLDGTPAGLTATELGYVDGVTSSIQTQLDAKATTTVVNTKAPIASPTFTGTPAVPTASASTNTTQAASTAYVTTAIANLADSAPATLNTLNELAAALGDDANFSTTVTNSIATKAPLASAALTGTPTAPTASAGTNTTQVATTAYVTTAVGNVDLSTKASLSGAAFTGEVTTTGQLGVGTTSPTGSLHLTKTNDAGSDVSLVIQSTNATRQSALEFFDESSTKVARARWDNNSNQFVFGTTVASSLEFATNNTERMRLTSSGQLALGTTSPNVPFHISHSGGTGMRVQSATNESNILIQNDARTWKIVNYDYTGSGGDHLGFHDGTADRLIIGNAGQLGLSGTNYGTSGQVLTSGGASGATTWADAGGGGAYTLVASSVLSSAAASISLSGCFTTTYDVYFITTNLFSGTGSQFAWAIRGLDTSGNEVTSSLYDSRLYPIGAAYVYNENNQDAWMDNNDWVYARARNDGAGGGYTYGYCFNPRNSNGNFIYDFHNVDHATQQTKYLHFGYNDLDKAFGGLKYYSRNGSNFGVGSTVKIYGLTKS